MSSSPKYTSVQLQAERRQLVQEQRRRQAAAEQERRRAEEQRCRQARLRMAKDSAEAEARAVSQQVETLAATALRRFVTPELNSLRERLAAAAREAAAATDEAQARRAGGSLAAVGEELRQVEAQAQAAQFAERLAREEAAVQSLTCRIAAVDGARSAKFDPGALREVESLATQASEALAGEALDRVRRLVAEAEARLARHFSTVDEHFARWTDRKDRAEAAVAAVHDRLAGLRADDVVGRWAAAELAALESRGEALTRLLASERFAAAETECGRMSAEAERVVAAAQQKQLKEDEKQHVVRAAADVLRQMGFYVLAGYPAPERSGDPASPVIIQARHPAGRAVAISIPQEGEILWDVAGPKHVRQAADGAPVRSCPQIEQQIAQFGELLKTHGVDLGEPWWEGKDPDDARRHAEPLPADPAQHPRRQAR